MEIIVVDDEKMALENMQAILAREIPDAQVRFFRKPKEALEHVEQEHCDIAFLDVEMREMTGVELAQQIKEISPYTNIVFTTGYAEYAGKAMELHASGYILKPVTEEKIRIELENLRHPVEERPKSRLLIRTFGNFEVFFNGAPLDFQYKKTRELLAYLVDRKGALCTNAEIIKVLWNDEDESSKNSYLKNIRSDLLNGLRGVDCEDIISRQWGRMGIIPEKVQCDYYDFLKGDTRAINAYRGEYMDQYEWAVFHGHEE